MINRTFIPGCLYTFEATHDRIIFLAIACAKSDTNVCISLQRIDWPTANITHVNCFNIPAPDFQQWVKKLIAII